MLGKAEYGKYVLKSICEERIKHFLSFKVIDGEINLANLKTESVITFLDKNNLYGEFISRIPEDFRPLYRFAAFVSYNIGTINKDKFDVLKTDGTALNHATQFLQKSPLSSFEKLYGEWHLQTIFVDEVSKLKGLL